MKINTEKTILKKVIKPCEILAFCPYGHLVELFPLRERRSRFSCKVFGHDCPVFYLAEPFTEQPPKRTDIEKDVVYGKMFEELHKKFKKDKRTKK